MYMPFAGMTDSGQCFYIIRGPVAPRSRKTAGTRIFKQIVLTLPKRGSYKVAILKGQRRTVFPKTSSISNEIQSPRKYSFVIQSPGFPRVGPFVAASRVYVCRAHQCVKQGYKWDQDNKVVTVFSAPNYRSARVIKPRL